MITCGRIRPKLKAKCIQSAFNGFSLNFSDARRNLCFLNFLCLNTSAVFALANKKKSVSSSPSRISILPSLLVFAENGDELTARSIN